MAPRTAESVRAPLWSRPSTAGRAVMWKVWAATAVVLAFHAVWIGSYLAAGHQARDFIKIGIFYEGLSHASKVIKVDPNYVPPRNREAGQGNGYDGQFSYYMALDFTRARYYMDFPAYRYSRLLYPVVARAASLGDRNRVPGAMIAINWLALGGCTFALAAWLRRRSCSPWLALPVGLYPGLLIGIERDLTEPLAYALVAVGVYLFDYGGRRRLLWAAAAFGLAGLARQTTLVFPLCFLAAILLSGDRHAALGERLRSNFARASAFGAVSILPFVAYTGALYVWLGSVAKGALLEWVPFEGLVASRDWEIKRQGVVLLTVVAPSLILVLIALVALHAGVRRVEFAFLLTNVLLFVVLLPRLPYGDGYTSVGRVSTGVVLAAVFCIPWLRNLGQVMRRALVASFALWLSMLPVIFVYGFGG
jgi:hypothetical protein